MDTNNNAIRIINFIFILIFVFCISSCDKAVNNPDDLENIDCDNLKVGIINIDSRIVKSEINKLVTDLKPIKTTSDNIGHKENIKLLINRLNTQCNNINAELICYACIETNPPQSEILVTTDSVGIPINRVIDILTPADSNLNCVRIHE